jgi:hypothetical protein
MAWHRESTCSACAFVSRQLGLRTPCPWHAGRWSVRPFREPSSLAGPLPSADCPWPLTRYQYARVLNESARSTQASLDPRAWASRRTVREWA